MQEYTVLGRLKYIICNEGAINNGSKVLLVDYLMSRGDALNAAHQLIKQVSDASVAGCFCTFENPMLNGKRKLATKYTSLINLDMLKIESHVLDMFKQ